MMHQKCIVYRNTRNKTQSFTMDTRLTVLPIALTTVNDRVRIICFSFSFFWLFFHISSPLCLLRPSWQTSDSDILLHKCCKGWFLFYEHDIKTINRRCFWIGLLLHCCQQSVQVSHIHYAYAIFSHLPHHPWSSGNNFYLYTQNLAANTAWGMHMTAVVRTEKLYRRMKSYLQEGCVCLPLSVTRLHKASNPADSVSASYAYNCFLDSI